MKPWDLVKLSHQDNGAWKKKYQEHKNIEITKDDMLEEIENCK